MTLIMLFGGIGLGIGLCSLMDWWFDRGEDDQL